MRLVIEVVDGRCLGLDAIKPVSSDRSVVDELDVLGPVSSSGE